MSRNKKNKFSKTNKSKRDMLKVSSIIGTGLAARSPLMILVEGILNSFVLQAHAQESGTSISRYIFLQQSGGPLRCMYDHFINPYNDSGMIANKQVATKYTVQNGRYTDVEYSLHKYKDFYAPYMWRNSVPNAANGYDKMTNLLDNMLVVNGIHSSFAHSIGTMNLTKPTTNFSLPGLINDEAKSPIPALNLSFSGASFSSRKSNPVLSKAVSNSNNMLTELLAPFDRKVGPSIGKNNKLINDAIERAFSSLGDQAKNNQILSGTIETSRASAAKLIKDGFEDLSSVWDVLYNKYLNLIDKSFSERRKIVGISDKPIGLADASKRDVKYRFGLDMSLLTRNPDLSLLTFSKQRENVAARFAMTEFAITRNYSHIVMLNTNLSLSAKNLMRNNLKAQNIGITTDSHFNGIMNTLAFQAQDFFAQHACLNELISSLKKTPIDGDSNLFNDTVVQVGGEFNRRPRQDGSGADHGGSAQSTTLYSGKIKGPIAIGDMYKTNFLNTSATYYGSTGVGAKNAELNNKHINPGNSISTVAKIIGLAESPSENNHSLVMIKDGVVVPSIRKSKLVDKES